MVITCPGCGSQSELADFSAEEKRGNGGRNIICPICNCYFWLRVGGETILFPHATDQFGQPRQLRR